MSFFKIIFLHVFKTWTYPTQLLQGWWGQTYHLISEISLELNPIQLMKTLICEWPLLNNIKWILVKILVLWCQCLPAYFDGLIQCKFCSDLDIKGYAPMVIILNFRHDIISNYTFVTLTEWGGSSSGRWKGSRKNDCWGLCSATSSISFNRKVSAFLLIL